MSNLNIGAMKIALDKMLANAVALAKKVPPLALRALNAELLQGTNAAGHRNLFNASYVNAHVASGNNPHGVTPELAGVHSVAEIDGLFDSRLPPGGSSINFFGKPDDFPLDLSGAYESSLRLADVRYAAINVETDGTLTILRNGTDGGVRGAFMGYVADAINVPAIQLKPTYTGERYRGAYFAADTDAAYVWQGGAGVIAGQVRNSNTGALGLLFISLMDGTLRGENHRGVFLPSGWGDALSKSELVLTSEGVYMLMMNHVSSGNLLSLSVYRIPLTAFSSANAQTVTPTQITACSGTDIYSQAFSSNALRIAPQVFSTNLADKPIIYGTTTDLSGDLNWSTGRVKTHTRFDPSTGKARGFICHQARMTVSGVSGQHLHHLLMTYELTLTPTAAVLNMDGGKSANGTTAPLTLTRNGTGSTPTGPAYRATVAGVYGINPSDQACFIASDGGSNVFTFADHYYQWPDDVIVRCKIATSSVVPVESVTAAYRPDTTTRTSVYTGSRPPLPSALGAGLGPPIRIPSGWLMYANGKAKDGTLVNDFVFYSIGADGFQYKSLNNGSVPGFTPNTRRYVGKDEHGAQDWRGMVTKTVLSTGVVTASPALAAIGFRNGGMGSMDANNIPGDAFTMTEAAMYTLGNAVVDRLKSEGKIPGTTEQINVEFITGAIPGGAYHHVLVIWRTSDTRHAMALARFYGPLGAGMLLTHVTDPVSVAGASTNTASVTANSGYQCNYQYLDTGTELLLVGRMATSLNGPGASNLIDIRAVVDRVSGEPAANSLRARLVGSVPPNNRGQVVAPGFAGQSYVIAEVMNTAAESDYQSKVILSKSAANGTELLAGFNWDTTPANWKVLAGVQVASSWTFSFNQAEPLCLGGQYFTVAPTTIDLTQIKANPANTTFYVYAARGSAQGQGIYEVTTAPQTDDALMRLFLGTVRTGATQVENIQIDKVVCLGKYRLSTTARGQSIPVSAGLPSRPGSLLWK